VSVFFTTHHNRVKFHVADVITLLLLHPLKRTPVQVWPFEQESVIRIGRSTDNHVILYSAVVSRHHVELRQVGSGWEIENLGTNGTYLDGKRITKIPVTDGAIIRLARSGPNIQIRMGTEALKDLPENLRGDRAMNARIDPPLPATGVTDPFQGQQIQSVESESSSNPNLEGKATSPGTIPVPPHLQLPSNSFRGVVVSAGGRQGASSHLDSVQSFATKALPQALQFDRLMRRNSWFVPDIEGDRPLQTLQTIGDYQVVYVLGQGAIGVTYLAWHEGKHVVLKTMSSEWMNHPKAQAALDYEAELLRQLHHPKIPQLIDFFSIAGRPYLAMEMLRGENLARRIAATGPVSAQQAIAWMIEICEILEYLHGFNPPVLHRNIEPTHILCCHSTDPSEQSHSSGATWLEKSPGDLAMVGFGTAKAIILGGHVSVGSTGYSSPDQLDINASTSVDLYSLGPMFAYLLTGQPPVFFCQDGIQGHQFCADSMVGFPPEIIAVIRRLTHPDISQRYGTASDVISGLQALSQKFE
jgi:hypothetical protein